MYIELVFVANQVFSYREESRDSSLYKAKVGERR